MPDASNPGGLDCENAGGPPVICSFDISWSETAGDLTNISIALDAEHDNIGGLAGPPGVFGLTGGPIASDGTLGGCTITQCVVSG